MNIPAMRNPSRFLCLYGLCIAIAALQAVAMPAYGRVKHKPRTENVHFIATGMLIRRTWGANKDTYYAELDHGKSGAKEIIRVVDEYSPFAPPVSHAALVATNGAKLRLIRDESCDISFANADMRTVPGDPLAILPIRLYYKPAGAKIGTKNVPCYQTHGKREYSYRQGMN